MTERQFSVVGDGAGEPPGTASGDELRDFLAPIPDVIEDIRNGRMVVVVDDEDRENEGDLIVAAQMATPDAINFMAKHGRGLICLAMTAERIDQLGLSLMSTDNRSQFETAFTTSIEAREGITTGISASDRARTVAVAIDPLHGRDDIVTPGHVFPLRARDGGVLVRTGHTEAAVDLARLSGLNPSGVICEIMNEDGTMARLPDLVKFAQFHGLKVATIADLIAYRLRHDSIVERSLTTRINRREEGDFRLILYRNNVSGAEHIALVKGDISGDEPLLVRMHAVNILDDMIHDTTNQHEDDLEKRVPHHRRGGARRHRDHSRAVGREALQPDTDPSPGAVGPAFGQRRDFGAGRGGPRDGAAGPARLRRRRPDPQRSRRPGPDPDQQPRARDQGHRGIRP